MGIDPNKQKAVNAALAKKPSSGGLSGMLSEATHLVKGLPVGLFGLGKQAVDTVGGFGLNLNAAVQDTLHINGPGSDRFEKWKKKRLAAGLSASQWDYAKSDIPLVTTLAESFSRTGGRAVQGVASLAPGGMSPGDTDYAKAYRDGRLLSTVLEDVGNVALVGGLAAKGAGAAGLAAKQSGNMALSESLLNASGKIQKAATLGAEGAGLPAKVYGLPIKAVNRLLPEGTTVGGALTQAVDHVAMNPGDTASGRFAAKVAAPLSPTMRLARQAERDVTQAAVHEGGRITGEVLPKLQAATSDAAEQTAARLMAEGRRISPGIPEQNLIDLYPELKGRADEAQIVQSLKIAQDYQAGRLAPDVVARLDAAQQVWVDELAKPRMGREEQGLGRQDALDPQQLTREGRTVEAQPLDYVVNQERYKLERARDATGRAAFPLEQTMRKARTIADAKEVFSRMGDSTQGLISDAVRATRDEARTMNIAKQTVSRARAKLAAAIDEYTAKATAADTVPAAAIEKLTAAQAEAEKAIAGLEAARVAYKGRLTDEQAGAKVQTAMSDAEQAMLPHNATATQIADEAAKHAEAGSLLEPVTTEQVRGEIANKRAAAQAQVDTARAELERVTQGSKLSRPPSLPKAQQRRSITGAPVRNPTGMAEWDWFYELPKGDQAWIRKNLMLPLDAAKKGLTGTPPDVYADMIHSAVNAGQGTIDDAFRYVMDLKRQVTEAENLAKGRVGTGVTKQSLADENFNTASEQVGVSMTPADLAAKQAEHAAAVAPINQQLDQSLAAVDQGMALQEKFAPIKQAADQARAGQAAGVRAVVNAPAKVEQMAPRIAAANEKLGVAQQGLDQAEATAARQTGLAHDITQTTVRDARSAAGANERARYDAGLAEGKARQLERAYNVFKNRHDRLNEQIAALGTEQSPLLATPQERLHATRLDFLKSVDNVVSGLGKDPARVADMLELNKRLNAAYSSAPSATGVHAVSPEAHLAAYETLKSWDLENGTAHPSNRHGGFTAEEWNKIDGAFTRQRAAERKIVDTEMDAQAAAAPARLRTPMMNGKRQVRQYMDLADKAWESGDRVLSTQYRRLAEDVPASMRQMRDLGQEDPWHFIGGAKDPGVEGRTRVNARGRPFGAKKLTSEFKRDTATFEPNPIHYLGTELTQATQATANNVVFRLRNTIGKTTRELAAEQGIQDLMALDASGAGYAARATEITKQLQDAGWTPTPIKMDGTQHPSGIRNSKSGLFPPNASKISQDTVWMPREVYRYIEHQANISQGVFLSGLSAFNSTWKQTVLPFSIRWHVGNVSGNIVNAVVLGGVNPFEMPKFLREGAAMMKRGEIPLRTFESKLSQEVLGQFGLTLNQEVASRFGPVGNGLRTVMNKSYALNNFVDSAFRAAVFAAKKAEGLSDEMAVKTALRSLGDFTSMTPYERLVLREVFPFYAWTRHMTQAAFRLPMENPIRAAWTVHLSDMMQPGDDQKFPEWMGPVVKVGAGYISTGFLNPVGDMGMNPVLDPTQMLRGVSPALKIAVAGATGRNLTRGGDALTRPTATIQYDADGNKVLNQRPSLGELAGFTLKQVPMASNFRDVLSGGGSARFDTGQRLVDGKTGETLGQTGRLASALKMVGVPIPTGLDVEKFRKEREARLKAIAKAKAKAQAK